jgi:hypothetical protein
MGELMQFAKGVWTPAALSHAISPNALSRESKGEEGTVTQEAVEEEAEEEDATGGEEEDAMGGDEDDEAMVVVEEEVVVVEEENKKEVVEEEINEEAIKNEEGIKNEGTFKNEGTSKKEEEEAPSMSVLPLDWTPYSSSQLISRHLRPRSSSSSSLMAVGAQLLRLSRRVGATEGRTSHCPYDHSSLL